MFKSKYEWQEMVSDHPKITAEQISEISTELGISKLVTTYLFANGYKDANAMQNFLHVDGNFHDPFLLFDMEKAIERIQTAIASDEAILIYGDYDADGITSTTILYEALETIGANVVYYLPDRFEDGYGPNEAVYKYYIDQGIQLIITVDNGVAGFDAIDYAQSQKVDVIVTDHHEIGDHLPAAYAIIHPRHPEGNYPFGDLSGAGVALKVAQALLGELPAEFLDIAAIGTVADLVSLTDENRAIVKLGLEQLKHTERLGLQLFFEKEHIDSEQINEETIGFILGPRLNALGRIKSAQPGVELLTSFDEEQLTELIETIEQTNNARKGIVEDIEKMVEKKLSQISTIPRIIVMHHPDWHQGVLGIVASRIVEKYQRPTILLSDIDSENIAKGSARSIAGIDIYQLLKATSFYMQAFGGHEMAAGMTVPLTTYAEWVAQLEDLMANEDAVLKQKPRLQYISSVEISDITVDTIRGLDVLRPFGTDNPKPYFLINDSHIEQVQQIGKDKNTLKLMLKQSDNHLPIIGFRKGEWAVLIDDTVPFEAVVELTINRWQNIDSPQARLIDGAQVAPSVFDLRKTTSRQRIFAIENALYVMDNPIYQENYQQEIPNSSQMLLVSELIFSDPKAVTAENLVIFDCIHQYKELKAWLDQTAIKNIYLFAYTNQKAYLTGLPTREEFKTAYLYFKTHPNIELKNKEKTLAQYLNFSVTKLKLIMAVFMELNVLEWQGKMCVFHTPQHQLDFEQTDAFKKFKNQIQAEQFLLYNDVRMIKNYYFQEDQE